MKALSLRSDYAWDVMTGEKPEEYRPWNTTHRGDLLICSTQKPIRGYVPGHALCVVSVEDVEYRDGIYAWILKYRYPVDPFPVKGQQRLYTVNDDLIKPALPKDYTDEDLKAYREKLIGLMA